MSKWRKKPVVIEAVQHVEGEGVANEWPGWLVDAIADGTIKSNAGAVTIRTLEGEMTASPGDWIIRGVAGEIYPCKPEIFQVTYEPAETGPPL